MEKLVKYVGAFTLPGYPYSAPLSIKSLFFLQIVKIGI